MRVHVPTSLRMKLRGTALAKLYSQADRWLITLSRGRLGSRLRIAEALPDPPVLVLETTGRKTGKLRGTPLMYLQQSNGFVVVASNGGHSKHPAWWLNLSAEPRAFIRVGGKRLGVRARELDGGERARVWDAFCAMYPGLTTYQSDTERAFPVVLLERL